MARRIVGRRLGGGGTTVALVSIVTLPGISGTPSVSSVLTAETGEYTSVSPITATVGQWLRNGAPIPGAINTTYTLAVADVGAFITYEERVTNGGGTRVVVSNSIGPITAAATLPVNVTPPSINNLSPEEGALLTFTWGVYTGTAPITQRWQLQRETGSGSGVYADISGATGAGAQNTTYTVTNASVGRRLRLREVASNVAGSAADVFSTATAAVTAATPAPIIANQTFDIDETAGINAVVGTIVNTGGPVGTWAITGGNTGGVFDITGGVITVVGPLDFETTPSYALTITATNGANTDGATITIDINDVDEGQVPLFTTKLNGTSQAGREMQYTQGLIFIEGALQPTDDFTLRDAATLTVLPTQLNVLRLWNDGSVRHARVTTTATIAEGATLVCQAMKGIEGATGTDLSLATVLTGRTLSITLTPTVGTPWTQNLYATIPAERWIIGPLSASTRVEYDVPGANFTGAVGLRVIADITAFLNGDVRIGLRIANDKTLLVGGGRPTYAATVTMDSNTVVSFGAQTHAQYTSLAFIFGTTSAGAVLPERPFVLQDPAYMGRTGLIETVDTNFTLDASQAAGLATILASPTYNVLKDRRGINASLGASGDAGQIGWFTQAQAVWLASNGTILNAARVMRGWADSTFCLWPHQYWADDEDQWVMPRFAPNFTSFFNRTSAAGTPWATAQGLPTGQKIGDSSYSVSADHGHQGPWYFLSWMTEAERIYSDGVAAQASWAFTDPNDRYFGFGVPDYDTGRHLGYGWNLAQFTVQTQARSCGHDFRAQINAAKMLPSDYPGLLDYIDVARGQMNWLNSIIADHEASLNVSYGAGNWERLGALPFVSESIGHQPFREVNPGWQHDFIRRAVLDYIKARLPDYETAARPALEWLMLWYAEAGSRTTGDWKWKNTFKQLTWAPGTAQQRYATLDDIHNALVASEQISVAVVREFTADTGTNNITLATSGGSSITESKPCNFTTTGTLPAPLVVGQKYYIRPSSQSVMQIANSSLGTALDLTTTGTGIHTITVYSRNNADPDWISNAYGGSGDYMRRWIGLAIDYLDLPNPNPLVAYTLHRLISEDADFAGMPNIYDANLTSQPRTLVTRPNTRRSYLVAPTVRAGQSFVVPVANMAIGGLIGVVMTDGGLPCASTENGTDAMQIDPTFTYADEIAIDSGGAIRLLTASPSVLEYTNIPVRARNDAGTSSYVNITSIAFDAVAPVLGAAGPFSVADNASVGYVVATIPYTGSTLSSVSITAGDAGGNFSVHIVGANTIELRTTANIAGDAPATQNITIQGTNLVSSDSETYTVNVVVPVSAPIISAGQTYTVEEGVDVGTLLTGNSGIVANTGGTPTAVSLISGNTGSRFALEINGSNIRIKTNANIALGDGSSYTLGVSAGNTGGTDTSKTVGVTVGKAAYIWNIPSSNVQAAYSIARRVRNTYTGPLIRVRRSSDNTEQDIGFSGGGNTLNETALTTFVGANSAFVVTVYDQSPLQQHLTQATTSLQPRLVNAGTIERMAGTNTVPAMYVDAGQCLRNVTFATGATAQFSAFGLVTKRGENAGSGGDRIVSLTASDGAADNSGQTSFMLGALGSSQIRVSRNTANTDYSATTLVIGTGRFIAGITSAIADYGRRLFVNAGVSTANTVAYTAMNSSAFLTVGALSGGATSQAFDGHIAELCLLSTLEPATDLPNARTNINTFAGL